MEGNPMCEKHNKQIHLYCKDCKSFLCLECLLTHKQKSCEYPISLIVYAKEILDAYEAQVKKLEEDKQIIEDWVKSFISSSGSLRKGLILLKDRLQDLLDNIEKSLDILGTGDELFTPTVDLVKTSIKDQHEELKEVIDTENLKYIVEYKYGTKGSLGSIIEDRSEGTIVMLSTIIQGLISAKSLDILNQLLKEFSEKYKIFSPDNSFVVRSKFVYGTCNPQSSATVLCKLDIHTKKLMTTVTVPQHCATLQMRKQIFISGGYNPCVNTLSEFIEETKSLVTKQSMKYARYHHSACIISSDSFVVVGGYNDSGTLSYCEEYSITENKWNDLPSLKVARYSLGMALINNKFLYVIGGYSTNEIEVLDISVRENWELVKLTSNELTFNNSPRVMKISNNELLIFCGGNTANTGIFNIKNKEIKKSSLCTIADYFYNNSPAEIKGKIYLLGYNGNVYIYDKNTKKVEGLSYNSIFP